MKKIIIAIGLVVILNVFIVGKYVIQVPDYKNNNEVETIAVEEKKSDKKVIAEISYINFAHGFSYHGTVICDDGSVYNFSAQDEENYYDYYNYKDLNKLNEFIFNNVTEYVGNIDEEELIKIKEYSKNIEKQDLLQENFSVGRGSKVIDIWNYENNERIELQLSGDWNGKNDSKNSEELTKTIEKIFERFFPEDK